MSDAILANFGVQNQQIVCDTGEILTVQTIARVLPNARLVCKCLLNGAAVYAKIYVGPRANIHAARELAGTKLLQAANVLTPNLLLETSFRNQPVVVYEAIKHAQNAELLMQNADAAARKNMAVKLVQTVAQHHNANLIQTDIHLKNFLIAGEAIYTIDGDGIQSFEPLKDDAAIQNLALLLSKMDVLDIEKWQQDLAQNYSDARTGQEILAPAKLAKLANEYRLKAASDYADKKVFRTCTDVAVARPNGNFLAIARPPSESEYSLAEFGFTSEALDDLIAQTQQCLKDGNSATVISLEINDKAYALKRYNIKNNLHALKRAFQPSRAAISWANAHRLQLLGIATPKPTMLLETRQFGLRGKAYFLSELLNQPDAVQFFASEHDKLKRAEAVKNIVTLFYKLYLLQISHGDMKATNIKMQGTQPALIDLDSMQQHARYFTSSVAHLKDLHRFMQNWKDDASLYNAFVKTFKVVYPDTSILVKAGIYANKEII